jgi:hypothetical protein
MRSTLIAWALSGFVLLASAAWLGYRLRKSAWGVFVDSRGRFSLNHMQLILWTVIVLSLIVGVFIGRLMYGPSRAAGALNFAIPNELLIVMGISIGSATIAGAIKTNKDTKAHGAPDRPAVATRELTDRAPEPAQAVMVEEGGAADQAIDIAKFQNFWFTLILISAYVALAIARITEAGSPDQLTSLPGFDAAFVTLLGISHAGYLAGKLPDRPGIPGTIISFTPKRVRAGEPIEITAGGQSLVGVTEVRFGTELGANLTHPDETTLRVELPMLPIGQRVPVKLIAPDWESTASDTLEAIQ